MSAIESMFNHLANGNQVTTAHARTMFKVENVADLVYRLRNLGVTVYTNKVTTSRGIKSYAYRIGNPSAAYLGYIGSRHLARARKTLYRDAINVTMAA